MPDEDPGAETAAEEERPSLDWVDILATVIMAVAALFTAWSAFQSDQWSDNMAFSLNAAGAARTESSRAFTRAGQLSQIDVASYFGWVDALQRDLAAGDIDVSEGYVPDAETVSGFLYGQFRPEFAVAMDAWLATRPFANPDAPETPFAMPEYEVAETAEAERLQQLAEDKVAEAQAADRNDDKYVLSTIIFAAIFLFAGLSTKMRSRAGQLGMLGVAVVFLFVGAVYLVTVPIQV
ncbi:MAG: hypothetical protein EHM57_03555 [Actinobacteria bacterium]|nr:MAG: hypothetical protein EHM57_03555 [Actinomycetota bacterium]